MQKQNKINKYKTFNENSNKPERDTFIFYKWSYMPVCKILMCFKDQ